MSIGGGGSGGSSGGDSTLKWVVEKGLIPLLVAILGGGLFLYWLGSGNQAPKAAISVKEPPQEETRIADKSLEVAADQRLSFDAYSSHDFEDGNSLKKTWELTLDGQDGQQVISNGSGFVFETEPLATGRYSLTLTVEDSKRRQHTDRFTITVKESTAKAPESQVDIGKDIDIGLYETWWQPWSSRQGIPSDAYVVSYEEENGVRYDPLFLCRAEDEGMLKPGKVLGSGDCEIPDDYSLKDGTVDTNGRSSKKISTYEVFVPQGRVDWMSLNNEIDSKKIVSTDLERKEDTIICRLEFESKNSEGNDRKAWHPGILDTSINHCIFPWGEVVGFLDINDRSDTYEVLVISSD